MWKCPSVGHLECRRRRLRDDEDEQLASSSALAPLASTSTSRGAGSMLEILITLGRLAVK
jgi:hypothetical protein